MANSMYTSASAMAAYSDAMNMYAANTANAQTTSAKRSTPCFRSQVAGDASGNSSGITVSQRKLISQAGLLQLSDLNTDCGVAGEGFFVTSTSPTSKNFVYTRKGDFSQDSDGNLVNTSGNYLMAWPTDTTGKPVATNLADIASLKPVNLKTITGIAQSTTTCGFKVILNSEAPVGDTHSTPITFYDQLGQGHTTMFKWTKLPLTGGGNIQWQADVSITDSITGTSPVAASTVKQGTSTGEAYAGLIATFNTDGSIRDWTYPVNPATTPATTTTTTLPPALSIAWNNGAGTSTITPNFSGVQSLAGENNNASVNQDGIKYGYYTGVSINEQGLVNARFDNGDTTPIFKIPLVKFANADGLQEVSGNAYLDTTASGGYILNQASTNGMGKIESGSLESSNTDLAAEFVGVMITNRSYAANAKMITVADHLLETVENLLR